MPMNAKLTGTLSLYVCALKYGPIHTLPMQGIIFSFTFPAVAPHTFLWSPLPMHA